MELPKLRFISTNDARCWKVWDSKSGIRGSHHLFRESRVAAKINLQGEGSLIKPVDHRLEGREAMPYPHAGLWQIQPRPITPISGHCEILFLIRETPEGLPLASWVDYGRHTLC